MYQQTHIRLFKIELLALQTTGKTKIAVDKRMEKWKSNECTIASAINKAESQKHNVEHKKPGSEDKNLSLFIKLKNEQHQHVLLTKQGKLNLEI